MTAAAQSKVPSPVQAQAQAWSPEGYERNAGFVADLARDLLDDLSLSPGARVLDLGCGDGRLSLDIQARGAQLTAVDSSPEQVAAARSRGVDARVMDGRLLGDVAEFHGAFDAVFTNATLHWMGEPTGYVPGIAAVLKPGGRFVGEFGGAGNVHIARRAIHEAMAARGIDPVPLDPWTFPTAEQFAQALELSGCEVQACALNPRPTPLPTDLAGWLETFAGSFLTAVPAEDRAPLLQDMVARAAPALQQADGSWQVDYVRLRFSAVKGSAA